MNKTTPDVSGKGLRASELRTRAFLIALPLIVLDNCWIIWMEKIYRGPYVTSISLFANCVFILVLLVLVNALLRKINCRLASHRQSCCLSIQCLASPRRSPATTACHRYVCISAIPGDLPRPTTTG